MDLGFKSVGIIARPNNVAVLPTLQKVLEFLRQQGVRTTLDSEVAKLLPEPNWPSCTRAMMAQHCELLIVLGGDGSFLNAAHTAVLHNLPIIGINRGHLGFLTDLTPQTLTELAEVLAGQYREEARFILHTEVWQPAQEPITSLALNDVVLIADPAGQIANFTLKIADEFVCDYTADGVIVATPTGSTAHALSGGGPILHPTLAALTIIPMLSHNLSSRPIVIRDDLAINLTFVVKSGDGILVRCDGQIIQASPGSTIKIRKAQEKLRLLHPLNYNYFDNLRTKLGWETK